MPRNAPDRPASGSAFPANPAAFRHDAFFKAVFSNPKYAGKFFSVHLPREIADSADWASLAPEPDDFVRTDLAQIHCDLLFSVKVGGERTFIYLLFEHQSQPEADMHFRIMAYMLEIHRTHMKKHGLPAPAVLPVVISQGPQPWPHPTRFSEFLQIPGNCRASLMPFVPDFQILLVDLARVEPSEEVGDIELRAILELMKRARLKQARNYLHWFAENVAPFFPVGELLRWLILYLLNIDETLDTDEIVRSLESNPELKKEAMSTAEMLVEKGLKEGLEKGLEKGLEEGLEKGIWAGKIQMLQQILGRPATPENELKGAEVAELESLYEELNREYAARFKTE